MTAAGANRAAGRVHLVVRDEPESVAAVRATLDAIAAEHGLAPDAAFGLKIAATEAVANALRHPASHASGIDVIVARDADAVEVEVTNDGAFTVGVGADEERGRGVPLMLALADEVAFARTRTGTRVRIRMRAAA